MAFKKWIIGKPDRERAKQFAEEFGIDPFVALLCASRGITDDAELELFLSNEPLLCDPKELKDITVAADVINAAIENGDQITVYGDYDCDGVVSTVILFSYLHSRGAKVNYYIPDRISEGYGLNIAAIDKIKACGTNVIVTVDNGISSEKEVDYANSIGLTVVVTDHHLPPEKLPDAAAVVDPHRVDCPSDFKEICGAEVAFKLACVLDDKEPEQMIDSYADILSVAIVGDVMPLVNENRSIVKLGVSKIIHSPSTGISAILSSAGVDRNSLNSGKISFGITPRINAAGRMGSASRAAELLLSDNISNALCLAGEICDDNVRRQSIEREIFEKAVEIIEENGFENDRVIVVSGEDWHFGVIGIVASRLCDRYGKPSIVLSCKGDLAHGSGRSLDNFNLFDAILAAKEHLTRFGGHDLAAGVSLNKKDIDAFRNAINAYAKTKPLGLPTLNIDFKLNPAAMSVDMAHVLRSLEPFGNGNPMPVFALCNVRIERISDLSGGKHLRLTCSRGNDSFNALLFGCSRDKFCYEVGDVVDLAVNLEENYFRDEFTLNILVRGIRKSGIDEDALFESKAIFEDYISGKSVNANDVLPLRSEIGEIFKTIKKYGEISIEKLIIRHLEGISYARIKIAVTVLCELDLISLEHGIAKMGNRTEKTDLMKSKTYKSLSERSV